MTGMAKMKFILASKSPRRREILSELGLDIEVVTSDADESFDASLSPREAVEYISRVKGEATREKLRSEGRDLSDTVIISADTVVSAEGRILGKPRNAEDAREMLRMYSGRTHSVLSGVTVILGEKVVSDSEETLVSFDEMTEEDIDWYIKSGECFDKAGAYGIQGRASIFVRGIEGSYHNVVGLPTSLLRRLLRDALGVSLIDSCTCE